MHKGMTALFARRSVLSHAVRAVLGLTITVQALPALSLDQLPADNIVTEASVNAFQQDFGHLTGRTLAEAVLTQSGTIAINPASNTLFAPQGTISLMGSSLGELAATAWGVAVASDEQIYATRMALDALELDSTYPYGSFANAKATVLKRLAHTVAQKELLEQQGLHSANYLASDAQLNNNQLDAMAEQLFQQMAQDAGIAHNHLVDLTERTAASAELRVLHSGGNALPEIIISGSDSVLRGQSFDPMADVFAVDAEDGDLTAKVSVQGQVDTARVGSYELKYRVADSQGQETTVYRTITVTQNESSKPRINGAGPRLLHTGESFDPMAGVTAWDEEDGDLTDKISVSGAVDTSTAAVYLVNYAVMDSDGHSHRRNRMVLVENLRAKSIEFKGLRPVVIDLYDDFDPMAGIAATDATDGNITDQIKISNPVDTSKGGLYRVRYEVTNSQGTTKVRFKTVMVRNSLPELYVTPLTSIRVGDAFDPMAGVTAADREDGDLTSRIQVDGEVNTRVPDVYTLRYRVEDNNAGVAERLRRVQVSNLTSPDNALPTVHVETFTRIPVDGSFDPMAGVTAFDNEDGDLTSAIEIYGSVDTTTPGYYPVVYSVTDSFGSVTSVERRVHVYNYEPVILGARAVVIPLGSHFNPMEGVTANDREEGDLTAAIRVAGSVDTSKGGVYSLLYSVEDRHGGQGFALRSVVVENKVPEFAGLEPVSITHDHPFDPLAGVTATDSEDGDLTSKIRVTDNLDISKPGHYVLTYTVKDSGGAYATGMRSVVVKNTVPQIHGIAPVTITAGQPFDAFAGITASDAEDGDLTAALQVRGEMDSNKPGIYTLNYSVKDSKGAIANRARAVMVKAAFNTAPELHGVSASTIGAGQAFDPLAGITASDVEDGNLSSAIEVSGSVDTDRAGRYRLTYRVSDSGGKSDTAYRMVTVTNSAPVFGDMGGKTIAVGTEFDPMAGITASDKEEGDITSKITVSGNVDTMEAGRYSLRYRVEDSHGGSATKMRYITVTNSAPELNGIERASIPFGGAFDPMAGVSAFDEEDGDITGKISVSGSVNTERAGNYRLRYSVTDNHGKTTRKTRTVNVKSRFSR